MQILEFRPYKKLYNEELLEEIDRISKSINNDSLIDNDKMKYFNLLIYEAKARQFSLNPKTLYNRIIYSVEEW